MRMMAVYYGKPFILLIDEYDVPLAKASTHGYCQEMLEVSGNAGSHAANDEHLSEG